MEDRICNCTFKVNMTRRILKFREEHPEEAAQLDEIFEETPAEESPYCCMSTFLMNYAYCEECTLSVSEFARRALAPLIEKTREK